MHFEVSENQLNQSKIKLWKILDVESSYSNCIYHQGRRNWAGARARAWQSIKLHFEILQHHLSKEITENYLICFFDDQENQQKY